MKDILYKNHPEVKSELFLQPVHDIHLYSNYKNGKQAGGRIEYIRLFSVIAVFILLIACINFINLSTARSAKRAKEVGIRKVTGAGKYNIAGQFMGEAILISVFALIASVVVIQITLPHFNLLAGTSIIVDFFDTSTLFLFLGITTITCLLSGIYPSFYLSSLNPAKTFKRCF
jgi:ABC-type antimicrobial peptide transport system permease subunit